LGTTHFYTGCQRLDELTLDDERVEALLLEHQHTRRPQPPRRDCGDAFVVATWTGGAGP